MCKVFGFYIVLHAHERCIVQSFWSFHGSKQNWLHFVIRKIARSTEHFVLAPVTVTPYRVYVVLLLKCLLVRLSLLLDQTNGVEQKRARIPGQDRRLKRRRRRRGEVVIVAVVEGNDLWACRGLRHLSERALHGGDVCVGSVWLGFRAFAL